MKIKFFLLPFILCTTQSAQAQSFDPSDMVAAHNRWRAKVGVPPLGYSTALAASSQRWADELKKNNRCRMRHSSAQDYGENLYWASAVEWTDGRRELQRVSPDMVVDDWGSEQADYDHASNRCAQGKICGHYTQVVWNTTTAVGCAVAVCDGTLEQIWVCQYSPPGNWVGKKPY